MAATLRAAEPHAMQVTPMPFVNGGPRSIGDHAVAGWQSVREKRPDGWRMTSAARQMTHDRAGIAKFHRALEFCACHVSNGLAAGACARLGTGTGWGTAFIEEIYDKTHTP